MLNVYIESKLYSIYFSTEEVIVENLIENI